MMTKPCHTTLTILRNKTTKIIKQILASVSLLTFLFEANSHVCGWTLALHLRRYFLEKKTTALAVMCR